MSGELQRRVDASQKFRLLISLSPRLHTTEAVELGKHLAVCVRNDLVLCLQFPQDSRRVAHLLPHPPDTTRHQDAGQPENGADLGFLHSQACRDSLASE